MFGEDFKKIQSLVGVRGIIAVNVLQREKYFSSDILIEKLCWTRGVPGHMGQSREGR